MIGRRTRDTGAAILLAIGTIAVGTVVGRWIEPAARAPVPAASVPFPFPEFAFADQDGAVVSRRGLLGKTWLASLSLPTCDDEGERLRSALESIRAVSGPFGTFVTFWVGAGDQWRSLGARGAPAGDARWRILAADPGGDGSFLAAMSTAIGRRVGPEAVDRWSRALFVVDASGVARAVHETGQDDPTTIAAELGGAWPVTRPIDSPRAPLAPDVSRALAAFRGVDEEGRALTDVDLRGTVVVADFIYTSCAGVCPTLSARMVSLQRRLASEDYAFVSFSVDPEHDTPVVLKSYAERWNADRERWRFVAADRDTVARVARSVGANVGAPSAGAVLHSDRFALVDRAGVVRGSYAVTERGELERLVRDARALAGAVGRASPPGPPNGAESLLVLGCMGCHGEPRLAPALVGLAGSEVRLANDTTVIADRAYLTRSILEPAAEIVAGFPPAMPSYAGQLDAAELATLVNAVEALSARPGAAAAPRVAGR